MDIQHASISSDDHLWVVSNVPWLDDRTPTTPIDEFKSDLLYLIYDPYDWIAQRNIQYYDDQEPPVLQSVSLTDHYFMIFRLVDPKENTSNIVQGISGTGMLSISPGTPAVDPVGKVDLPPLGGLVEVTLVENSDRAYIHLQIGPDREVVAKVGLYIIFATESYYEALQKAFEDNGKVVWVDGNGKAAQSSQGVDKVNETAVTFGVSKTHTVYHESRKSTFAYINKEGEPTCTEDPPISCSVDIGNYVVNPDGSITIIVDHSTMKMY